MRDSRSSHNSCGTSPSLVFSRSVSSAPLYVGLAGGDPMPAVTALPQSFTKGSLGLVRDEPLHRPPSSSLLLYTPKTRQPEFRISHVNCLGTCMFFNPVGSSKLHGNAHEGKTPQESFENNSFYQETHEETRIIRLSPQRSHGMLAQRP